ncbi:MAG: D-tyrosyl-tRNA(Tyr) deacylase [Bacteroidetes bacterium]|nr:MAG: D-tyrosyl-tRNA(Tyr) deacylase [Bacteroidota bacterium]
MRVLVQRVSEASVTIDGQVKGAIGPGLLVFVGIETEDTEADIDWLVRKVSQLRIFGDAEGKMNLSVKDIDGEALVISQFTLMASTKKGNRPSYIRAARPEQAIPLYETFVKKLAEALGKPVATGEFGADMKVRLCNDGPVTIWIDSKNPE